MITSDTNNNELLSPEISVIIPFHGNNKDLTNCLNGLLKQKCEFTFEIIVVESGNDESVKKIFNSYPEITFISFDAKIFPGKARNTGASKSRSDFLVFIDSDCVPDSGWISGIYSSLKNGFNIVIGPIINLYPFHPIASVDNLLVFPDFQKYRPSKSFVHFPPCNLGITKKLFLESGGFPEDIPIGEDTKFSRSVLQNEQAKIIFNNKIIVRHSGRRSLKEFIKHQKSFGYHRKYPESRDVNVKFKQSFLYSALFGLRRLIYISIRTLQWNPAGMIRIIVYFPLVIIGLSAWVIGFREKNKKVIEQK